MKQFKIILTITAIFLFCAGFSQEINPENQWSSYRGYYARGYQDNANLPDNWNMETKENIKWTTPIPGLGLSCPVLWDDKLFVTTAISEKDDEGFKTGIYGNIGSVNDESVHEWKVYCIDNNTGKIIWEKTAHKGVPAIKRHPKSSHANSTLAIDGRHVVAFFGSEGLYCYDFDGNLLWEKDFGVLKSVFFAVPSAEWEFASSPLIHEGVVIIQCDVMENSFVAAFDVESGKELWKKERDEYPGWSTPNIYYHDNKAIVAVNGYKHRGGYDFETGAEIWKMSGGGDIPIPTPIVTEELIYFNSAHGKESPVLAIKTSAKGDITLKGNETGNEYIPWSKTRGGSYMQTMLVYDNLLYNCRWNGVLACFDPLTGEEYYNEKVGDRISFTASPVASDGKIYVTDDNGKVYIIKAGTKLELITSNDLQEVCMVTPAIHGNTIYFRTIDSIIAIGKD